MKFDWLKFCLYILPHSRNQNYSHLIETISDPSQMCLSMSPPNKYNHLWRPVPSPNGFANAIDSGDVTLWQEIETRSHYLAENYNWDLSETKNLEFWSKCNWAQHTDRCNKGDPVPQWDQGKWYCWFQAGHNRGEHSMNYKCIKRFWVLKWFEFLSSLCRVPSVRRICKGFALTCTMQHCTLTL